MTGIYALDQMTEADLEENGFLVQEPWSDETVYSPSALVRLENADVFHPTPLVFVTFSGLALVLVVYIIIVSGAGAASALRTGVRKVKAKRAAEDKKEEA